MRLRFTIRDLLWLTALAAVCVAWWASDHSLRQRLDDSLNQVRMQQTRANVDYYYAAPATSDYYSNRAK